MLWTKESTEQLEFLLLTGESYTCIAEKLGKSYDSVIAKIHRLGIHSYNSWSIEKIKILVDGIDAGISLVDIAIELNISLSGVKHKARSIGLLRKSWNSKFIGKISPKDPAILYLVYFPRLNLYKIGITGQTIFKRLQQLTEKYEIILEHKFKTGQEAWETEQEWLKNIKSFKINTGQLRSGNTETFRL